MAMVNGALVSGALAIVDGALVSGALLFEPMLTPLLGHSHLINKSVKLDVCESFL